MAAAWQGDAVTSPIPDQTRRSVEMGARALAQQRHRYRIRHERPDLALNGSGVHTFRASCSCGAEWAESSAGGGYDAELALSGLIGEHVESAARAAGEAAVAAFERESA